MTAPDETSTTLARASALISLSRFEDASAELAGLLAREPGNGRALCLLAQARLGARDPQGAYRAADSAVSVLPGEEWPLRLSSIAMLRLGMSSGAADRARAAVRVAPHEPSAHAQLALALAAAKTDLDAAADAANEAVRLAPHQAQGHFAVGEVAIAQKDRAGAISAFERALAIDPTNSAAKNELARAQLMGNRFGGGRRLATAAGGFAAVMREDPSQEVSRRNIDVVIATFMSRLAYYVFLVAYLMARVFAHSGARWVGAAALVLPALFAIRFTVGLSPALRGYLWRSFARPVRGAAVACLGLGAVLLVAGGLSRSGAPTLFGTAAVLAIVARVVLYTDHRRSGLIRKRKGRRSR